MVHKGSGYTLLIIIGLLISNFALAQKIERIDPPHWWAGMQNDTLSLLIKGNNLSESVTLTADEVRVISAKTNANNNYLFLELHIPKNTHPQKLKFNMGKTSFSYLLKARETDNKTMMGLNPSDLIYLITPDRFANGNQKNDIVKGMNETKVNRKKPYARHGGDLEGITQKLDYLADLGVSALWLNPVLENNQEKESYHGYAITDHYKIDPRFGSNLEYAQFVNACHTKGIKVIMDVVYNHFGNQHYLITNLPEEDFLNNWPTFTQTNYRATTLHDPYSATADKKLMTDGWFTSHMPDLNQRNKYVSNYLIQNSIWWIEEFGVDAFRIDTYAYADDKFMADLANAIELEYPLFFMFGETWVHGIQVQTWFTGNNPNRKNFNSNLQSVTDFQLAFALHKGLEEEQDWATGINRIYYALSGDYLYSNPENLVTFLDNHDIARTFGLYNEDFRKFKMAYSILLTTRGIPQIYYGTEVLMKAKEGHGEIREDFLGGWSEDTVNKFTSKGRTALENEAFDFIKTLANYRKNSAAITRGKLVQFVPEKGVYCYFRYTDQEQVMVIVNATEETRTVKLSRFNERLESFKSFENIITKELFAIPKNLELKAFETKIFEVK